MTRTTLKRTADELARVIRANSVHQGVRLGMAYSLVPEAVMAALNELADRQPDDADWNAGATPTSARWPNLDRWLHALVDTPLPDDEDPGNLTDDISWYQLRLPEPDEATLREADEVLAAEAGPNLTADSLVIPRYVAHLAKNLALAFPELESRAMRLGYPSAAEWLTAR